MPDLLKIINDVNFLNIPAKSFKIKFYKNVLTFLTSNTDGIDVIVKAMTFDINCNGYSSYTSMFSFDQLCRVLNHDTNVHLSSSHDTVMLTLKKDSSLLLTFLSIWSDGNHVDSHADNFSMLLRPNCEDNYFCKTMYAF